MKVAGEIVKTADEQSAFLHSLPERVFSLKITPTTWSAKEITGHLIDSAQNNLQRFIRGQYENVPRIIYAQNEWVRLGGYQQADKSELIELWRLINHQLGRVLRTMDTGNYSKLSDWGHDTPDLHTLAYMAEDYHRHMLHHLNQLKERISTLK
jgi:DinB superfamily